MLVFSLFSVPGYAAQQETATTATSPNPQDAVTYGAPTSNLEAASADLRQRANQLWGSGHMTQAAKDYLEIVRRDQQAGTNAHLPADLYAAASLSIEVNKLEDAKDYYERSLEILKNRPLAAAEVRVALGGLLALIGSFSPAETQFKTAIADLSRYAGPNDLRLAKAWNDLGWVYTAWGKMDEAEIALHKAQAIVDKTLSPDSLERIHFLDYQAEFLGQTGRYAEAERLWRHAVEIAEKSVGANSPQFDTLFLHLGQMYCWIGEYKSAEQSLEHFLSIESKVVPSGSIAQAVALGELANSYTHLREYPQAESNFMKSLSMMESIPDKVPLASALISSYLGDYYMTQREWSQAADQYRRALDARQKLVPNSALVAGSMASLSDAFEKLKRKNEANKYKKEAQAILATQHNPLYSGETVDLKSFRRN
ncbi:MAG TPA: tetratricopeptide repeat protein [Bryobacteraceae bacterium]|nr:tetratricopeptide repeat protein [Bryobacteraceae bacterium]